MRYSGTLKRNGKFKTVFFSPEMDNAIKFNKMLNLTIKLFSKHVLNAWVS